MSVGKKTKMCVYMCVWSPYTDAGGFFMKSLYRGGYVKSLGTSYTHTYTHYILFPTDMKWCCTKPLYIGGFANTDGASQSPYTEKAL